MTTRKLLNLLALVLMVFALAVSASAQGTRGDIDGDGIPDDNDRCPRQYAPNTLDGCPGSPTITPPPMQVDDRDGDGVLDFVDRCPDQAGTGFTEGCPTTSDPAQPTPVPPPFQWESTTACMVANLGTENVNIRAFIPDPNNPAQPVFLGVLQPGDQFSPAYVDYDVNNTPWYAGVGAQLGLPDGQIGWVNGVVTTTNGVCDYLSAPPDTGGAHADIRICLIIVPEGEDVPVFSRYLPDDSEIRRLEPGSVFPASGVFLDESGAPWFRGLAENGWVRGIDVVTEGNCFPLLPTDIPDEGGVIPLGGGGGGICTIMIPDGEGVKIYYSPIHDDAFVATILAPGYVTTADYAQTVNGVLWYHAGGWLDSTEVLAAGNCQNLPAPPESEAQCQFMVPASGPDVSAYQQPVSDPALLLYTIPAGSIRNAAAKTWDSEGQIWYWTNTAQAGWVSGAQVTLVNPAACNQLVIDYEPFDDTMCMVMLPDGAASVNAYMAPAHDPGLIAGTLLPGNFWIVDYADVVDGTVWYFLSSVGYVDGSEVIVTPDCNDLPPYSYSPGYGVCYLFVPSGVPGVVVLDNYEGDQSGFVTMITSGGMDAIYAATNSQGERWYYVKLHEEGAPGLGWVNSAEVIEQHPDPCNDLPPMIVFHIPDIFLQLAIQPLVYPLPEPITIIGQ